MTGQFEKGNKPKNSKPVKYDGIIYNSQTDLANKFKTSGQLIRYYIVNDKLFGGSKIKEL